MDTNNNDNNEGASASDPGPPVIEWAPPQDRGEIYREVPNVVNGGHTYTELWRRGQDQPSLRFSSWRELLAYMNELEENQPERLAREAEREIERSGNQENEEENIVIEEEGAEEEEPEGEEEEGGEENGGIVIDDDISLPDWGSEGDAALMAWSVMDRMRLRRELAEEEAAEIAAEAAVAAERQGRALMPLEAHQEEEKDCGAESARADVGEEETATDENLEEEQEEVAAATSDLIAHMNEMFEEGKEETSDGDQPERSVGTASRACDDQPNKKMKRE